MNNIFLVSLVVASWGLRLNAAAAAGLISGNFPQGNLAAPPFSSGQGFQADLGAQKRQEGLEKERLAILAAKAANDLSAELPKAKGLLEKIWKKATGVVAPADLNLLKNIDLGKVEEQIRTTLKSEAVSLKGTHDSKFLKTVVKLLGSSSAPSSKILAAAIAEVKNASKVARELATTSKQVASEVEKASLRKSDRQDGMDPAKTSDLTALIQTKVTSTGPVKENIVSLLVHAARFNPSSHPELGESIGGSKSSAVPTGVLPHQLLMPSQEPVTAAPPVEPE